LRNAALQIAARTALSWREFLDRFIASYADDVHDPDFDGDLIVSHMHGVAWQSNMQAGRIEYNGAYFQHYVALEGKPIAVALNEGRRALVDKYVGPETGVLDIGVGSGEFIASRQNTFGYDVNTRAEAWLKACQRWSDKFAIFDAFTFWDVLEHIETPEHDYFRHMRPGTYLFTSLPIFDDLTRVRESKHYKPGEHLYYWEERGFVNWMALHRFELLEVQDYETSAGREGILSFAFRRQ
jgi:hypothetical protein